MSLRLMTFSWMGLLPLRFRLEMPIRTLHSCSKHQISALTYHLCGEFGIRISCSSRRRDFRPSYRWTSASGRLKARLYPNGNGRQLTKSTFADTSKKPRFSFQFFSSSETVELAFGYQTSLKEAVMMIFTIGIVMDNLGEGRRHTS